MPRTLTATAATPKTLSAAASSVRAPQGVFPSASTYPGATVYPGSPLLRKAT